MTLFQRLAALIRQYPLVASSLVLVALLGTTSYLLWRGHDSVFVSESEVRVCLSVREGVSVTVSE